MTTVVQEHPLRQCCLNLCLLQGLRTHKPDHRGNEVGEGRKPLDYDDGNRSDPPKTPWPIVPPSSDQISEREQCERQRCNIDPKQETSIGPPLRRNVRPLRNDDSGLVNSSAESNAKV